MNNLQETNQLLQNIKKTLPRLERLLEEINAHWGYEDYRFYNGR